MSKIGLEKKENNAPLKSLILDIKRTKCVDLWQWGLNYIIGFSLPIKIKEKYRESLNKLNFRVPRRE